MVRAAQSPDAERGGVSLLVRSLTRFLWRYERAWAWAGLRGMPRWWLGESEAALELERLVGLASISDMPCHVLAASCPTAIYIAHGIHATGPMPGAPFVETSIDRSIRDPGGFSACVRSAQGGTLVVRGLGAYPTAEIPRILPEEIVARSGQGGPRLIFVDEIDARTHASSQMIDAVFADTAGTLSVRVPTLRDRLDDFDTLCGHHCGRFDLDPARLSPGAYARLRAVALDSGDELVLERLVARIVANAPSGSIGTEWMDAELIPRPPAAGTRSARAVPFQPLPDGGPSENGGPDDLASAFLDDTFGDEGHEAVRGAMLWAAEHHHRDISTHDAADAVHVSSSHLSHLLKAELGTSFRLLLSRIRIEHARRLLAEDMARTVTDVALDVGFGDLSHFIKSFSRFSGMTPSEYRKRAKAIQAAEREGIGSGDEAR